MREKQKQPASFQPDRILSYFKAEWAIKQMPKTRINTGFRHFSPLFELDSNIYFFQLYVSVSAIVERLFLMFFHLFTLFADLLLLKYYFFI